MPNGTYGWCERGYKLAPTRLSTTGYESSGANDLEQFQVGQVKKQGLSQ